MNRNNKEGVKRRGVWWGGGGGLVGGVGGRLVSRTPKGLLRAVFFYNGKNFTLRGGQEHRNLQD